MAGTIPSVERPDTGSVPQLLKRSVTYIRPYWKEYLVVVVLISAATYLELQIAASPKRLIEEAIKPQNESLLRHILTNLALMFAVSSLFDLIQIYILAQVGSNIKKDMRIEMFEHLQELSASYFSRTEPGEVVSLFTRELFVVRDAWKNIIPKGFRAVLQLLLALDALSKLNPQVTMMVIVILPITSLLPRLIMRRATEATYKDQLKDAAVAYTVQDSVAAYSIIRAFGLGNWFVEKFKQQIGRGKKEKTKPWAKLKKGLKHPSFLKSLVQTATDIQQAVISTLVIGVGAYVTFQGQMSVAELAAYISLLGKVGGAVVKLSGFFRGLIASASGLQRIDEMMDEPAAVRETLHAKTLPPITERIRFHGVSFSYDGKEYQLEKVGFTLPIGQSIAIVGRSGSGKSTILKLMMRLYDPTEGRVLIDGHDLREVSMESLHDQIGAVLQEAMVLNTTVRDNIGIAKPSATDEEIEAAARAAEIHDAIAALPLGYDTKVGEQGKLLSQGQRQRMAIARAILRNPKILLLDEVTSALDPESEAGVVETLKKLEENRTLVMVSHRLSTVSHVDFLLVMEDGMIVEQGSHEELLAKEGLYHRFWQIQNGFVVSADGQHAEITEERLRAIPLFADLKGKLLKRLSERFVAEHYEAGQTVLAEGRRGEKFYIIVRGTVDVSSSGSKGQTIRLARLEDGDYFGEIALMEGGSSSYTVETALPTLLLTLERKEFLKMLRKSDAVREVVEETALSRSLTTLVSLGRRGRQISLLDELMEE